jgi:hypothetical protein
MRGRSRSPVWIATLARRIGTLVGSSLETTTVSSAVPRVNVGRIGTSRTGACPRSGVTTTATRRHARAVRT